MTIQNLIDWLGEHHTLSLWYFSVILMLTVVTVLIVKPANLKYVKYVMSGIVYAVTIPGILASLLTLYVLLIMRTSLLDVNIMAYFMPIVAMIMTLVILNKRVVMSSIPGFGRLSGLMIMIGITFTIVFVLQKTYFGVLFIGSFLQLLVLFVVLFIVLMVAWSRFTK